MITTLLGKKVGMTRIYDAQNVLVPVTVVEAGPCPVVQVKTTDKDGYNAVQIAYGEKREKLLSKAEVGHLKKHSIEKAYAHLAEVRMPAAPDAKSGDLVTVANFAEGSFVDVIGVSKGRGFQGVIKRHGMAGGPAAHGSMFHRRVGSIGMRMTPGRTLPGQRMPGHLGAKQRTVQNLQIIKVLPEKNVILIRGGIPGANGSSVVIRAAIKKTAKAGK